MAGEWKETTIGEQVQLQRGFDITKLRQNEGGVPVVSTAGILSFHDTAMAKGPGVILGRKGNGIGRAHYVTEDYWPHDTTLWVRDFKGNEPKFVFYFFAQLFVRLQSMDVGSANPTLNRNHVHPIRITWPPLREQQAIACILGALDDKIELNRRRNRTLEAMARAIFQSWFVDFDPVKAKAAGRKPAGLSKEIAALFPDRFEDSSLGPIPKGCRVVALGDCVARVAMGPFGSSIKTDNFVDAGVPVIRGGNLTAGFVDEGFVYLLESKADQLRNANAFPGDVVITHRGTLGQVGLIPSKARFARYVVSQSQMLIRPNPEVMPSHYLYFFLTSEKGQHALLANTSQTGVPAIAQPTASVKAIRAVCPSAPLLAKFESQIGTIRDALTQHEQESRTLAALRDALLPKLISGELRVPDAERIVGRAV